MNKLLVTQRLEHLWLWFFPRRCVWCQSVTEPRRMFCFACENEAAKLLQEDGTLPDTQLPLVSVLPYKSKGKQILMEFKFQGARSNAHSIGYCMGEQIMPLLDKPEDWLFCPVPMTTAQVKRRGYNQSALLTQAAAKWVGAPYDCNLLLKCHETEVQHSLPAAQREANVRDAFKAASTKKITSQRIVLCDDICTTGATLRACCNALQNAGAKEIICLTFLRTLK